MNSQDILNYVLAVGVIVAVASFSYTSFRVAQAFKIIKLLLEKGVSYNFEVLKDRVKFGFLDAISSMLNTFLKEVR